LAKYHTVAFVDCKIPRHYWN